MDECAEYAWDEYTRDAITLPSHPQEDAGVNIASEKAF
jgi:hypothetical protein